MFPGLFSYRALVNLDVRDFDFWTREARRRQLLSRIDAAHAARMGQATQESYEEAMRGYQDALDEIDGKGRAVDWDQVRMEWAVMKAQGRG